MTCAVIVNPVAVRDVDHLRRGVEARCPENVLWFETTEDDPGGGQARNALAKDADLVLVCGGDGTVSACVAGMAGSEVPMALIPVGTGNLLARNLGLPLDLDGALDIAFGGVHRQLDVLDAGERRFLVMAGLGFDAVMIRDTDSELKSRIGWLAYVVGAARALRRTPYVRYTIRIDGEVAVVRRGVGVLVGNVGTLQGGIAVLPDAEPDDGYLDVVLLAPRNAWGWPALAARILVRRIGGVHAEVLRGRRVEVEVSRPVPVEYDGDTAGVARALDVRVLPGALTLCYAGP